MGEIPLAPLERIMRKSGAKRVSEDAVIAMAQLVEDYVEELSEDSIAIAKSAGKKTVEEADVLAAKKR